MAGNALQVEAVDAPPTPIAAGERGGQSHSTAIYWWQIALLAARAGALEAELERERRQHQRVIDHYERLLGKRNEEIDRLEAELATDEGGLVSLVSR